jgi:hypothetical protein
MYMSKPDTAEWLRVGAMGTRSAITRPAKYFPPAPNICPGMQADRFGIVRDHPTPGTRIKGVTDRERDENSGAHDRRARMSHNFHANALEAKRARAVESFLVPKSRSGSLARHAA